MPPAARLAIHGHVGLLKAPDTPPIYTRQGSRELRPLLCQGAPAQCNTRSVGARLAIVRHAGRLHHLPRLVPLSTEEFKVCLCPVWNRSCSKAYAAGRAGMLHLEAGTHEPRRVICWLLRPMHLTVPLCLGFCGLLCGSFVQGYGTCVCRVSGANKGRPEKRKKRFHKYTPRDGLEEYAHSRALLDRTIPTPDGVLLRYIAGKVYEVLKNEFGPKPADQTWDWYLAPKLSAHGTWFDERGLGIGEMAVFIAIMKGRPDEVPLQGLHLEDVDELVGSLFEECENLWKLVRP